MEDIETAFGEPQATVREPDADYAPADFLRQFGAIIAICLGLALMTHALVMVVGQH